MTYIKHVQAYSASAAPDKHALVMCGFGGSIWQVRRLVGVLRRDGYHVTALDFSKSVLAAGDLDQLPALIDEVVAYAESNVVQVGKPIMYSEPAQLHGKRLLFIMPKRDKLIDTADIHREVATQQAGYIKQLN